MKIDTITTMIVDDEQASIQCLARDLSAFPEIKIIETITSVDKARKAILKQQPDLLFLDVEMPGKNGIELLQEIRTSVHPGMCVVFYSAFDKYMIDALRTAAFDYLLKPYLIEELTFIIKRIKKHLEMNPLNFEQSIRRLLSDDRKFAIQTLTGLLLLKRSDVLYFRFLDNSRCWQMMLVDGSTHKLRAGTIAKELLDISASFMQTSQDCILNLDYLISIENKTLRCILYPPYQHIEIIASRRCYTKIKEQLEII